MHRRASAWFGASFLLACIGSLGAGALIREHIRAGHGFWVISGTISVVRDQHLGAPFRFLSPMLTLGLWLVVAIGVGVLLRGVRAGAPGLSALPEMVAGLFIGGGLANAVEALAIGSVTDFLGIQRSGAYSAGDIAMDVASSLLPITAIRVAQAQHRSFKDVLRAGAVFYAAVVIFAVALLHDYAVAALVTLVVVGCAGISLSKRLISRHPTQPALASHGEHVTQTARDASGENSR